ncbi:hypothetical protein BD0027_10060 [Helicobacter pylori]
MIELNEQSFIYFIAITKSRLLHMLYKISSKKDKSIGRLSSLVSNIALSSIQTL